MRQLPYLLLLSVCLAGAGRATELTFYGPGYIGGTTSLAIAPNGELWAANGNKIAVYGTDGKYLRLEKVQGHDAVLFTAEGEPVTAYSDQGFSWYHAGQVLRYGSDFGATSPRDIARDDQGFIYAVDGGHNRIQKYDMRSVGKPRVAIFPSPAEDLMSRPYSIALDATGKMFVTDEFKPGVWVLDPNGKLVKHLLTDRNCWRIRRGPDGMYVNTGKAGVTVFDPTTYGTLRDLNNLPGIGPGLGDTRGFAVDGQGNFYIGHQYHEIRKFSPEGKLLQIITASYEAVVTLPESCAPGQEITAPLKVTTLPTLPVGKIPPAFSLKLRPAWFRAEADLGLRNGNEPNSDHSAEWTQQQAALLARNTHELPVVQDDKSLRFTIPAGLPAGIYRLLVHADHGSPDGQTEGEAVLRAVPAGINGSLTLYVPRQRSVFQRGETIEINAIIRAPSPWPAGVLRFSLAGRNGLEFQHMAFPLQSFPVAAGKQTTLTFHLPAAALRPERYLLQAEFVAGGKTLRDTWPLQIVAAVAPTFFKILLPEWGAGYTNLVGPFTGRGMHADAAILGQSGITVCDVAIHHRGEGPLVTADWGERQRVAALMRQAGEDPALPAPERFLAPTALEVEMQEALRNGYGIQRDIWGGWYMNDWGFGVPLSVERDNRGVQLWTQWQREWPSWLGHRYLSLVWTDRTDPEAVALQKQRGLKIPSLAELNWACNRQQRQFITDANTPGLHYWTGIGQDQAGNITLGSNSAIVSYTREGKFRWKAAVAANNDLAVAPDGTVYGANTDGGVNIVSPDGKLLKSWRAADFSGHSPRGICLEKGGTLLLVDQADDGSGRQKLVRYTTDGKLVATLADAKDLKSPEKVAILPDGGIVVSDSGRGGLVFFKPNGAFDKFFPDTVQGTPGGTSAVCVAPDGTLWSTLGMWRAIIHVGADGKRLGSIAHGTLAVGGVTYPTSLAMTRQGTLLAGDIGFPYVNEFKPDGSLTGHLLGIDQFIADVRLDRTRYTWDDPRMVAGIWLPIPERSGDPANTLQAFARQGTGAWMPLAVEAFSKAEYGIAVPKLTGSVTLRLILAKAGATVDDPQHTDFTITVTDKVPATDQQRLADILQRERQWKETWTRTRMGALVRWTQLSDRIRPGTQNTAPANYGGYDNLCGGVWPPYRREALVAEAENEGTDTGTFPLMSPWYVACALAGANPRPAWGSLLEWYWNNPASFHRPLRDLVVLLGTGASGCGTGKPVTMMDAAQTALLTKVNDRLRRVGSAAVGLDLPGQGGVAVLRSFTQEAMAPDWTDEAFYTAHAAWYDLLRLHIPTAVVNEEFIEQENGAALARKFKAILLPEMRFPLPAPTLAALANFRRLGGEVWVDLSCRVNLPGARLVRTRYWPFWVQETYYQYMDRGGMGYDGNFEYWRMKQGSDERLPAVRAAFGRFATMPVTTADPNVFLQQRQGGAATYIFAGNDHYPNRPLLETVINSQSPVPATVPFQMSGGAVYDALAMQPVKENHLKVDFTDEEPARVWVVLPQPIAGVSTTASMQGDLLIATAQVWGTRGKQLAAVIPLEFTITDARGRERYHLWRATDAAGNVRVQVPVVWQASPGAWTVTVRELLSGKSTAVAVATGVEKTPVMTLDPDPVLVFDGPAMAAWMTAMKGKEVWIALDLAQPDLRPAAEELSRTLNGRGITARVVSIPEIPETPMFLTFNLTPGQQEVMDKVKSGQAVGLRRDTGDNSFVTPGPERAICRSLILLGDPAQNRWLRDIHDLQLVRRPLSPNYPGPGRALLQYAWAPFYDGYDVVTVSTTDLDGVKAGIARLLAIKTLR